MTKKEREQKLQLALKIYTSETISIAEASERVGISANSISNFLKNHGIEIKFCKNNRQNILKRAIEELKTHSIDNVSEKYGITKDVLILANEGISNHLMRQKIIDMAVKEYIETPYYDKSVKKISAKYGINKKTLKKYLDKKGVKTPNTEAASEFNRDIFDLIDTEEKAYWLGFMYADGFIGSKDYTVGLNISLKDIEHLKKFNNFLNYKKGLSISESHQFGSKDKYNKAGEPIYMISTVIKDKHLWEGLNSKGCVPNKSLILSFPDKSIFSNENLIYDFIRGYVDGDGTLGVYPHSKCNPKLEESLLIVGTKTFLEGVQQYLGLGFLMHKTNCNEKTYRLRYSTAKAHRAADLLYKNATIYLDRKYDIYVNKFAAIKSGKNGES